MFQWIYNFTIQYLKNKMSSDTQKIFEKVRIEHPNIFRVCINLIIALSISLAIKVGYTLFKYSIAFISFLFDCNYKIKVDEIEHIDLAGIICGILGIMVAFLITLYVEKDHQKESNELSKATESIKRSTIQILQKFTSFSTISDFSERLNVLEEIIDLTGNQENSINNNSNPNHIYIFNYNVSYGHVQSYNTSITLNDSKLKADNVNIKSCEEYHLKIHKSFQDIQEGLFRKLRNKNHQFIHFAVLKTEGSSDSLKEDKYKTLLKNVFINKKVNISLYNKTSNAPFIIENFKNTNVDTYAFSSEDERHNSLSQSAVADLFIEKLTKYNADKLKELISRNIDVSYLDQIPFEFFVTAPENITPDSKLLCMIIFTNILSLEDNHTKTVAFRSESPELIQNLLDIFHSFSNKYKKEVSENTKFGKFFNIEGNKVHFVLKRIPDETKERKEHDFLAYLSDIDCYSDLRELFSQKDISTDLNYDDDVINKNELNIGKNKTYINLGLFENSVTKCIYEPENPSISIEKFFNIWREHPNENGFLVEDISIARYGNNNEILEQKDWNIYKKNDSCEYGLLTKIKLHNQKTLIICGGLTSYGTKKLGVYIKNSWEKIFEFCDNSGKKIEGNYFTALFEIPKSTDLDDIKIIEVFILND